MPLVSVLTATYNRAHTLPRLYESLRAQTFQDFEWIVIDDGSHDDTETMIAGWAEHSSFPIRYEWQENRGLHAARNRGVELAAGRYCALIDSDDWYRAHALERMVATWESIPAERRRSFANVEGLCEHPDGRLVGTPFPGDVFDSDAFEIVEWHGCTGDTKGMYRRDVLAAFPAPTDLGYVTAALVWNRIAARYETRFVNEVWGCNGYEPGGMTDHGHELVLGAPRAWRTFWSEYAAMPRRVPATKRVRAHANYVRHSLNARVGARALVRDAPSKPWLAVTFPLGVALALRDRPRLASAHAVVEPPSRETVEIVDGLDLPRRVLDAWRDLAESRENLCVSPEWCAAWAAARPEERPLILLWRSDDVLRGVLPLVRARHGPVRVLRFPGARRGDWFGPACRPEDERLMGIACSRALLDRRRSWHAVELDRIDEDSAWPAALVPNGSRPPVRLRFGGSDVLPFVRFGDGGWNEYLAGRSRNMRSQLGRRRRRLDRDHGLAFRLTTSPEELEEDMAWLRRLHTIRWDSKGRSSLTPEVWTAHNLFARAALERGWLRLWNVEVDGRRAASWYGWRVGNRYCYSLSGFDPAYEHRALGLVLLVHTMEQAAAEQAGIYDLMWGDEAYKRRFETGRRRTGSYTLVRRSDPVGSLATCGYSVRESAVRAYRQIVRK